MSNAHLVQQIKEQQKEIDRLRATLHTLVKEVNDKIEPEYHPQYPCLECHGTGTMRVWNPDGPGALEKPCTNCITA